MAGHSEQWGARFTGRVFHGIWIFRSGGGQTVDGEEQKQKKQ